MSNNDIRNLLAKFSQLTEGATTPVSVKTGLNTQQKEVPQLPALFKPKKISVLGAKQDPEHPMKGYAVGANESEDTFNHGGHNKLRDREDYLDKRDHLFQLLSAAGMSTQDKEAVRDRLAHLEKAAKMSNITESMDNPVAQSIAQRVMRQHPDWLSDYGIEYVIQVIEDVAEDIGNVEEIGSSDVSAWVKKVEWNLKNKLNQYDEPMNVGDALDEGYRVMPNIDQDRYQERPGLEGPFRADNGKVVYYDPQEGKYYDPDTDMYIDHDEWQAMSGQGVAEGKGPQSKIDQQIIDLLVSGTPAKAIARKLDIPVEWVHEVSKYNMPGTEPDYSDPRNSRPANRFGEGVAESETDFESRRRGKSPKDLGGADAWYHRGAIPNYYGFKPGTPEYQEYMKAYDEWDEGPRGGKQWDESVNEARESATEDVLSTVKKSLGDYLSDLATTIKKDTDLKDKINKDIDVVGPAVKTLTTDDGHEIKIHGNEDDGFRITIRNKPSKSTFKDLDEASMAVEMFCARRRGQNPAQDYVDEN